MVTDNTPSASPGHAVLRAIDHAVSRAVARYRRARHRAAMLRAIDAAASTSDIWGRANRSDGLRAIRALERLNGRPFDPRDRVLVNIVRGQGPRLRRVRLDSLGR